MKNIHLLPTDKPSRLYKSKITQNIFISNIISQHGDATYNQHIYITSDEEIKDGDWFYNTIYNFITRIGDITAYDFKIILTTNKLLINDGVQAIDDGFLEWFVKNPSCEKVKIETIWVAGNSEEDLYSYKPVIPQEEPKQEYKPNSCDIIFETAALIENKQETLEESIERLVKLNRQDAFVEGAKWQAERMYSEEEVLELLHSRMRYTLGEDYKKVTTIDWFEQFKKK